MKKFRFSENSLKELDTCHPDLIRIAKAAILVSDIDFGIAEGYRTKERQNLLFKAGKSRIDGIKRTGKHNYSPSLAFDIYAYLNGKSYWREDYLAYLGGVITGCANHLYKTGAIHNRLRWGGNWDMDGEIITDQSFIDLPHFELL